MFLLLMFDMGFSHSYMEVYAVIPNNPEDQGFFNLFLERITSLLPSFCHSSSMLKSS
jgi:hypothetical protein